MPTLTQALAVVLVLAVVLIHAAWRRWHQEPPTCEGCGLLYCPGGVECIARDDLAVWREVCEGIDSKSEGE
jgi:hypothetical protein